jgi:hypothetical protein
MTYLYFFDWDGQTGDPRGVWVAPPGDPCWRDASPDVPETAVLIEAQVWVWDEYDEFGDGDGWAPTVEFIEASRIKLNPGDGVELEEGHILFGFTAANALKKRAKQAREWEQYPVNEEQLELLTNPWG